jgi:membrane protease YdiL (CAAX protease family)
VGNPNLLLIYLGLNLVLAGFGEEMVYRGYALPRVASLFGNRTSGWVAAFAVANVGFGLAHTYQGLPGVIEASFGGVMFGLLYLACGKNLIAPITAHFVSNSIDFTLIYLDLYPGVGQ